MGTAKKAAKAAPSPKAASPASKPVKPVKETFTKASLATHLAEQSGVEPKGVKAVLAALNGTLNVECVHAQHFATREQARRAIVEYIGYYTTDRLHSARGYATPAQFERCWKPTCVPTGTQDHVHRECHGDLKACRRLAASQRRIRKWGSQPASRC